MTKKREKNENGRQEDKLIVGKAYEDLIELVKKYAKADKPVLISGERGTGKELLAQCYMVENVNRKGKKTSVNCAAFTDTILQAEIFGHKKGSFTDATEDRKGLAETCRGGILFLDELGASSLEFQAKILRFVEYQKIKPVGADEEVDVNCLVIAATNAIANIREDLRDRFHVLPVPPLQKQDIPLFVVRFLNGKTFKPDVMGGLMNRNYPGNIRELRNECERLSIELGDEVTCDVVPDINVAGASFDYDRFRRELNTWQNYIAPILKANEIMEFHYLYQRYPPKEGFQKVQADRLIHGILLPELEAIPDFQTIPILRLIFYLLSGVHHESTTPLRIQNRVDDSIVVKPDIDPSEILPAFRKSLRECFEHGLLPILLEEIEVHVIGAQQTQEIPEFCFLLNLPFDNAKNEFKRIYYQYLLSRHGGKIKDAANAIGIKPKSLYEILRRLSIS